MKPILRYLRELSVVVAGIAITFIVSDLISSSNEKKEVQRYLNAIRIELEGNLEVAEEYAAVYGLNAQLSRYLMSNGLDKLSADSLSKYDEAVRRIVVLDYKTSAIEMFKMSGTMRLVKDEVLLNSLLEAYSQIEVTQTGNDVYMNRKLNELYEHILGGNSESLDLSRPENKRLLKFFYIYMDLDVLFENCVEQIKESIELLDKRAS